MRGFSPWDGVGSFSNSNNCCHLLGTFYVPGTALKLLHVLTHVILTAYKIGMITVPFCTVSQSQQVTEKAFKSRRSDPRARTVTDHTVLPSSCQVRNQSHQPPPILGTRQYFKMPVLLNLCSLFCDSVCHLHWAVAPQLGGVFLGWALCVIHCLSLRIWPSSQNSRFFNK